MQGRGRTVGELLAGADQRRREREWRESQERAHEQRQRAAARAIYLDSLAEHPEVVWRQVEALVEAKGQTEYAQAVGLLTDLRDVAARDQNAEDFEARLNVLGARNARKTSFLDRLRQAGLWPT